MKTVEDRARDRAGQLRQRVAARIARALPGTTIETAGERLVVTGRGVIARFIGADSLRDWREDER